MKRILVLISIIGLLSGTTVWAGSLAIPHTFQSGQKAMASEVNDNFTAVKTEVDDNASNIASNAAGIAANTDADTLDGLDSTDFADPSHSHPGLPTGVHWISPLEFESPLDMLRRSTYIAAVASNTFWPAFAFAPINIPFKCTITEMQFKARDNSDSGDIVLEVHEGFQDPDTGENVPIVSIDTSGWASTSTDGYFSTGAINLSYDPTNFEYDKPWWITARFDEDNTPQRLRWVRIYYTVP